ncbi:MULTISPECIES: hypothetical protein [unclassified Synechococcus]|uniref:hypothetical protein n=1 Tax=unclassified Synechococcus TaxID=2626047 RepID=UPI0021A2D408|nr:MULTISPECIES: hypothetical protein [unclassified Synechococcus]MCT0213490.1 hypothetical protein [Synechococcus sp. CS-1326]MCT0234647.1 hypothetical protein [Synechococcus sp. CS-1327]
MPSPLPDAELLLDRERTSRRDGSGLRAEQLLGTWVLAQTWPRRAGQPAALSSALLRVLGARLILAAATAPLAPLRITNRVQLGALELSFQGQAWLEGRRPLLIFRFEQLQLRLGDWLWLDRPLAGPPASTGPGQRHGALPFFALIATETLAGDASGSGPGSEPPGRWLAARGRGGGLALWLQAPDQPIARV